MSQTAAAQFKIITLDPGHFHASLVQKFMYEGVDSVVHVYAPAGDDVMQHLARINAFNTRAEGSTHWKEVVYTGADYFDRMLKERAGNVVVIAGNNARKTEYIVKSIDAGFNVLADKPMIRVPSDLPKLRAAFDSAKKKGVLLYDVMTERFEATNAMQRALSRDTALFGTHIAGTKSDPGVTMESVHYFSKIVAGAPLKRPPWFFDVRQEGEGIVDVTTHLVDLVQWMVWPDVALAPADVSMLSARRYSTPIARSQFASITGLSDFPSYLASDVRNDTLHVFSNSEFTYSVRGVVAHLSVRWDFSPPPGGGDTHYALFRGTRANLVIRQGPEQKYKPVLYVERANAVTPEAFNAALQHALGSLQARWPGVAAQPDAKGARIVIPEKFDVGHEAHFAQVTENFLSYLRKGNMPPWEVPDMLVKYYTIMQAYTLSHK
jgi:predicted dehydrogenase